MKKIFYTIMVAGLLSLGLSGAAVAGKQDTGKVPGDVYGEPVKRTCEELYNFSRLPEPLTLRSEAPVSSRCKCTYVCEEMNNTIEKIKYDGPPHDDGHELL